jgi:putative ABC transport system permease protein
VPFAEAVGLALHTMRGHRLRTLLAVLGTVVGVAFLIAVVTVIEGMGHYIEHDLVGKVYGFNTVKVRQRPLAVLDAGVEEVRRWSRNPALTFEDAAWLAERMTTPGELAMSTSGRTRVSTPAGASLEGVRVLGASTPYFRVQGLRTASGRAFTEREADRGVPVVVIGHDVAARLFPGRAVLGRTVQLSGVPFRVIGVLARQGSLFSYSMDKMVVVPARSPLNGVLYRRNMAEVIAFRVSHPTRMAAGKAELEGWLRFRHGLRPAEDNDFVLTSSDGALALWDKISRMMMVAGPALVGIALTVGALVSANVMLVSVSERTREIGIRMSLGARRRDILLQFLVEAGTTSGIGGAAGVLMGLVFAVLIGAFSPLPVRLAPWSLVVGVLLGVAVGLAAGVYPAYRASRLDPITALGNE